MFDTLYSSSNFNKFCGKLMKKIDTLKACRIYNEGEYNIKIDPCKHLCLRQSSFLYWFIIIINLCRQFFIVDINYFINPHHFFLSHQERPVYSIQLKQTSLCTLFPYQPLSSNASGTKPVFSFILIKFSNHPSRFLLI